MTGPGYSGSPGRFGASAKLQRRRLAPAVSGFTVSGTHDGGLGGENAARSALGFVAQTSRFVHRVTDHRVLVALLGAHVPGHDLAARHSDPRVEFGVSIAKLTQTFGQKPRRAERPGRVVGLIGRNTEHAEGGVALELVHPTPLGLGGGDDGGEELVQQADDFLRRPADRKHGRAGQVDEQRAGFPDLTAQRAIPLQCLLGDLGPDMTPEQITQTFPLPQSPGHLVESRLEQADLGGVVHLHRHVEIAVAETLHRPTHRRQGFGNGPGGPSRDHPAGHETSGYQRPPHIPQGLDVSLGIREGDADHEQRNRRSKPPRQQQPRSHRDAANAFGGFFAEREGQDRTHGPLAQEIDDGHGGEAAQHERDRQRGDFESGVLEADRAVCGEDPGRQQPTEQRHRGVQPRARQGE